MVDRIKTLFSALIGLLIGIAVTLPLFWLGVRKNVGALRHRAEVSFVQVERRQQAMADESLRLQKSLADLGWNKSKSDFAKVELLRSQLAGYAGIEDKIEVSKKLEIALLGTEKVLVKAGKQSKVIAKNPFIHDYELNWVALKRYLVDEEEDFLNQAHGYNHVLQVWPVPTIVGYVSFLDLNRAMLIKARDEKSLLLQQALAWTRWGFNWVYAKVRSAELPSQPEGFPKADKKDLGRVPLYTSLPEPDYVARAPKPEEDYSEIQYNREYPDMADVETGEKKVVFENKYRKPYVVAPVPTVQKTVTYK